MRVDLAEHASIEAMYREVERVDAVVSIAAHGALDEFRTLTTGQLHANLRAKFYGQADLVLTGQHHCRDGASFTLTSGIFADQAWPGVTGGGVISGALHSFVRSAAIKLSRRMRINAVSPAMVADSAEAFGAHFPGMRPVPMDVLVRHYLDCVEGERSGEVIRAYG